MPWKALIYAILILLAIFVLGWYVAMQFSEVRTAYERREGYLEFLVRYSTVDHISYKTITNMFEEIREQFKDVLNEEKLSVLEVEFKTKFKEFTK